MSVADQLREILKVQIKSLQSEGADLEVALSGGATDQKTLHAMTHKLKGSSGTAGFDALYEVFLALHQRVGSETGPTVQPDTQIRELLDQMVFELGQLTPEKSKLLKKMMS